MDEKGIGSLTVEQEYIQSCKHAAKKGKSMGLDVSSIVVSALALVGTLAGSYWSNKKTTAMIIYRLEQLEKKQDKHNTLIERTYKLEEYVAIHDEKIKVANHRIDDLEKAVE